MAELGAHLATTFIGEDEGSAPSIFEVLAQESLTGTLRPAITYLLKVLAQSNPSRYSWIYNYGDELYTVLDLVLENYYLRKFSASFAENFYGLKRISISQASSASATSPRSQVPPMLSWKIRLKSLLYLVLVPYIKQRCDAFYEKLRGHVNDSGATNQQPYVHRLCQAFQALYPLIHLLYQGTVFAYYLMYVFGKCGVHSPLLNLAGVKLCHLTDADITAQKGSIKPLDLHNKSFMEKVLRLMTFGLNSLAIGLSSSLSVGVFFLQFLEWWYAGDQHSASLTALPIPPPPQKQVIKSLPKLSSICPLCNRLRTNDTVLAITGYVFCYPCIHNYLLEHHQCPVTGYPARLEHLTKLYLETS